MKYHGFLSLPVLAVVLVSQGCGGLPPRAVSEYVEPPAWNLLERMMVDSEIVLVDPAGYMNTPTGRALTPAIGAARSSS